MNDEGVCRTAPSTPGLLKIVLETNLILGCQDVWLETPLFLTPTCCTSKLDSPSVARGTQEESPGGDLASKLVTAPDVLAVSPAWWRNTTNGWSLIFATHYKKKY